MQEIINLTELEFEQMSREKMRAYEDFQKTKDELAGLPIAPLNSNAQNYLTESERVLLSEIYANAHRKFGSGLTDVFTNVESPQTLTMDQARDLADLQLGRAMSVQIDQMIEQSERRIGRLNHRAVRIEQQFQERVARINTDAGRRGLLSSTAVINQLARANEARTRDLAEVHADIAEQIEMKVLRIERLNMQRDRQVETLAVRLHNESQRNALAFLRERGAQESRNLTNWRTLRRNKLELNILPSDIQKAIQDEVFHEYKAFLLRQTPARAWILIDWDPLFMFNLTRDNWITLNTMFRSRTVNITPS